VSLDCIVQREIRRGSCAYKPTTTQDLAEVESNKFHEARGSDRRLNNFFQVGLAFRGNDSFLKSLHIGMHHFGADSRNDLQKSLEELKPNR
jgi:hypothetical protein